MKDLFRLKSLTIYGILTVFSGLGVYFHPYIYGHKIPSFVGILILVCGVAMIFVSMVNDDDQV